MVLAWYCGETRTTGAPASRRKRADGVAKSTTAATLRATAAGSGGGTSRAKRPYEAGRVTPGLTAYCATTAPCEYPPTTIRVFGQVRAMDLIRSWVARTPLMTVAPKATRLLKLALAG